MFRSVLRQLLAPKSCGPVAHRLRVETLEDRAVPATFIVNPGQSIQATLDAAAALRGSDTVIVNAGTYTEALVIDDASGVTLKARGAVTVNAPADVTPLVLGGTSVDAAVIEILSRRVTVDGFRINGATNTDGELAAGIRVVDGGSATIRDNTVVGVAGSASPLGGAGIQIGTSRVAGGLGAGTADVDDNTVRGYKGAGIMVDGPLASATVRRNTVVGRGADNGGAQYGIQVSRGAEARVESNAVSNNTFADEFGTSAGVFFFQAAGQDNVAARNRVTASAVGVLVQESDGSSRSRLQVVSNDVFGNVGFAGIQVVDSDFVDVRNNDVRNNLTSTGITVFNARNVRVEGNDVRNNQLADGIFLLDADSNSIRGNEIANNGYNGIYAENSSNNLIRDNDTVNNGRAADAATTFGGNGVYIVGGRGNDIVLGASARNAESGVRLENTADNTIVANDLAGNSGWGVQLVDADNTTIVLNRIAGNGSGALSVDADSTGTVTIFNRPGRGCD